MKKNRKISFLFAVITLFAALFANLFSACPHAQAFIIGKKSHIKAENVVQVFNSTTKHVKVTGVVEGTQVTDHSKVIFLNFGKNFNTSLSAVIYDFNFDSFLEAGIDRPEKYFKNKKVVMDGVIRVNNGKPEIVISSPKQIKVVE